MIANNIDYIKRIAKMMKKDLNLKHHDALDQASVECGFENFADAHRYFNSALSSVQVKCMEKHCKSIATKDYNGHGHFVCNSCYNSLSNEFDDGQY